MTERAKRDATPHAYAEAFHVLTELLAGGTLPPLEEAAVWQTLECTASLLYAYVDLLRKASGWNLHPMPETELVLLPFLPLDAP